MKWVYLWLTKWLHLGFSWCPYINQLFILGEGSLLHPWARKKTKKFRSHIFSTQKSLRRTQKLGFCFSCFDFQPHRTKRNFKTFSLFLVFKHSKLLKGEENQYIQTDSTIQTVKYPSEEHISTALIISIPSSSISSVLFHFFNSIFIF